MSAALAAKDDAKIIAKAVRYFMVYLLLYNLCLYRQGVSRFHTLFNRDGIWPGFRFPV
jgi:hypothetical protein